ncbi:hypothetical protein D3C71_958770 [compost metagenome]
MAHGFIKVFMVAEPATCSGVQGLSLLQRAGLKTRTQYAAQQRMQAIPGFAVVALDLSNEQIVAVEPRQLGHHARDGVGLTEQRRAQRGAEAFADRSARQQTQVFRFQANQHLTFEILGEGVGIADLHPVKPGHLLGLEIDSKQLQAGDPAVGEFVQHGSVARVDGTKVLTQEMLRFGTAETQIAQVEFADLGAGTQACQWKRHTGAGTEHQMQIFRPVIE